MIAVGEFLTIYHIGRALNAFTIAFKRYNKEKIQCVIFIVTKVFVYLTHLRLPQINQIYLEMFVWLDHMIELCTPRIL